jgi:hypothetical protein
VVAVGVVPVGVVLAAGAKPWMAVISGLTHGGVYPSPGWFVPVPPIGALGSVLPLPPLSPLVSGVTVPESVAGAAAAVLAVLDVLFFSYSYRPISAPPPTPTHAQSGSGPTFFFKSTAIREARRLARYRRQ